MDSDSALDSMQEAGAVAFNKGQTRMENPYFKSANMPQATGDRFDQWQLKVNAWETGWFAAERGVKTRSAG